MLTAALRVHTVVRQQALTLLRASETPSIFAPCNAAGVAPSTDDYFCVPTGSGSACGPAHTLERCVRAALKVDDSSVASALVALADAVGYRLDELVLHSDADRLTSGLPSAAVEEAQLLAKAAQRIFSRLVLSAADGSACLVDVEEVEPLALDLQPSECRSA